MRYGLRAVENSDTNVYDASGNIVPADAGTTYGTSTGTSTGQVAGPPVSFSQNPTAWLNANSTVVMLGAGALVVLFALGKGRR
jgi:hypothetical protein